MKSSVAGDRQYPGQVPKREQPALLILRQIQLRAVEPERLKRVFQEWCRSRGLTSGGRSVGPGLGSDGELLQLPEAAVATPGPRIQWNPRSPDFGCADAAKRFKKVNNAQAMIWKMLLVAEKRFVVSKLQSL